MFTSKTGERNRKNKIFVDYLRNGFGATAVAAFSPRWRPGVGVSTPVAWEEIDDDIRGTHFNLHNVPARVAKQRKDPWAGYWKAQAGADKADDQGNGTTMASPRRRPTYLLDAVLDAGARLLACRAAPARPRRSRACSAAR